MLASTHNHVSSSRRSAGGARMASFANTLFVKSRQSNSDRVTGVGMLPCGQLGNGGLTASARLSDLLLTKPGVFQVSEDLFPVHSDSVSVIQCASNRFSDITDKYTDAMVTDYGKRLTEARKHAHLTQAKLGSQVGVRQGTISELEKIGHGSAYSHQIAVACGVDPHWLATGEGTMIPAKNKTAPPVDAETVATTLGQTLEALSVHLAKMGATARHRAGFLLAALADNPENHAEVTTLLEAVTAPREPLVYTATEEGDRRLRQWSENLKQQDRRTPKRKEA